MSKINDKIKYMKPGDILFVADRDKGIKEFVWHEKQGNRDRKPYLFFTKDGKAVPFKGESIPKVCVVKNCKCNKNGKWTSRWYTILLASGWDFYHGLQDWDTGNIFTGEAESWSDIVKAYNYNVDEDSIKEVIKYFSEREFEQYEKRFESLKEFLADPEGKEISDKERLAQACELLHKCLKNFEFDDGEKKTSLEGDIMYFLKDVEGGNVEIMSKELKPCPFCGGETVVRFDIGDYMTEEYRGYYVKCCGRRNANCPANWIVKGCFSTKEEAIEAWNRRVNDE